MNRRQALKNIGLGAGIIVVGPTTLSLLQSCKNDKTIDWEPSFLTVANGFALKQLLDVIIPATDTPGANDLNIARFIDSYMEEVASEERRENFQKGADSFAAEFKTQFDKDLNDGTPEEYEKMVEKYLSAIPQEQEEPKRNTETQDPMDEDPEERMDKTSGDGAYSYVNEVRELAIWAWKNSEEVGENVLWYDPVPGQYIACGTIEELSKGRAMSL